MKFFSHKTLYHALGKFKMKKIFYSTQGINKWEIVKKQLLATTQVNKPDNTTWGNTTNVLKNWPKYVTI